MLLLLCGVSVIKVPAQSQYPQDMLDLCHQSPLQFEVRICQGEGTRIDQYTQETERQPMEVRLPFIPQCNSSRHDTLVVDISRASGIGEEDNPGVFDFLRVHRNNVTVALWRKRKICREVEYPCQTDMLPE